MLDPSQLAQTSPDVRLRFFGAIHASLLSLADPLPAAARRALESFICRVVSLEELVQIVRSTTNPPLLRQSCLSMLSEYHYWNLTMTRRALVVQLAHTITYDPTEDVAVEALELLGQINLDCIGARQSEDTTILQDILSIATCETATPKMRDTAKRLLDDWSAARDEHDSVEQAIDGIIFA